MYSFCAAAVCICSEIRVPTSVFFVVVKIVNQLPAVFDIFSECRTLVYMVTLVRDTVTKTLVEEFMGIYRVLNMNKSGSWLQKKTGFCDFENR